MTTLTATALATRGRERAENLASQSTLPMRKRPGGRLSTPTRYKDMQPRCVSRHDWISCPKGFYPCQQHRSATGIQKTPSVGSLRASDCVAEKATTAVPAWGRVVCNAFYLPEIFLLGVRSDTKSRAVLDDRVGTRKLAAKLFDPQMFMKSRRTTPSRLTHAAA